MAFINCSVKMKTEQRRKAVESEPLAAIHVSGRPAENDLHSDSEVVRRTVSFAEAFRFWLKLGFISFGGPAGQIAIMHGELVGRRRWIGERRFLHALNFCMAL